MQKLRKALRFLSGYELSCILFLLLFVLTYLGTVTQVNQGLYQAQKKYFESVFLIHYIGGIFPLPLPGAYPVMGLLCINLFLGGIVRARKDWSKLGVLVAHIGILVLLIGAFISYRYAQSGHVTLYEGEKTDTFESYNDWEIGIAEVSGDGATRENVIAPELFQNLSLDKSREFVFEKLPFKLTLSYAGNADMSGANLRAVAPETSPELNRPGADIIVTDSAGASQQGIIWAGARKPLELTVGGGKYRIELRKRAWPLPFTIVLDKFTRELHPRTNMPREFRSDVTRIEDGISQAHRITMNEPLRRNGYTFYQSSWGPSNAGPGDRLYSVLAVVKNPADKYPLTACVIISFGLLLHFAQKLFLHLKAESRRAA